MKPLLAQLVRLLLCFLILAGSFIQLANAQGCNPPLKKSVIHDPTGRYFLYWKPVLPVADKYDIQLQCSNTPPCFFSALVDPDTALRMNGGWLGIQIPALPSLNSKVITSIFPEGCNPQFTFTPVNVLDVITDDLEYTVAGCDSDTCEISSTKYKNLNGLTNYYNAVCGGGGAAVGGTTVTTINADAGIILRRTAAGKWQLKLKGPVPCDTCFVYNFQVTCPSGKVFFIQDSVCFNYSGPPLDCRLSESQMTTQNALVIPNPAGNTGYVQFQLEQSAEVSINIYNSLGQVEETVLSKYKLDAGEYEQPLPVMDLSPGVYIVEVIINGDRSRMKLLKF